MYILYDIFYNIGDISHVQGRSSIADFQNYTKFIRDKVIIMLVAFATNIFEQVVHDNNT